MFTPSIWFFVLRAMATDRKRLRVLPYRRFLIGYGQPTFLHFWPVAWSCDRTFLLLAILSVLQPLQVFVTCLDITFFFIVRLTALFENVNMLLGGIYLRGLTSFSATPLVLIVSVGFECFFDGCIFDAIHFSNVSKICIHWMIPPFLCICGTCQPPCYTCDIYFFISVWRPIQDARHHDIFAVSLTR